MKLLWSIVCLSSCLVSATAGAAVTMNSSDYYANTGIGIGSAPVSRHLNTSTTTPFLHAELNAGDESSYSYNTISWDVIGNQAIFTLEMAHRRSGGSESHAGSDVGFLSFTANSNEPFEWTGYYRATDTAECGMLVMQAYLYDATANTYPFFALQGSNSTPNVQLTLGEAGGDDHNELRGSLSGNLIAGHTYLASIFVYTQAYPDADSGAYAEGRISLKVGEVPEPAALFILAIGTVGLLACRRPMSRG